MFSYRWIKETDYPMLQKWWKANRFTPPSREMLPDYGTGGFIVDYGGVDICAGFLYQTNSKLAWIEYIVANFEIKDRDIRKDGLIYLIESLNSYAKSCGFKVAFTSLKNKHLKDRYLEAGYLIGTDNTTELIKIL